ncbi:outer membrane lipoprotein-sorting protein [Candidatus Poribacteria bacterium]|nr:outer membrane lipoprotein-sorting protein [Candidatus Poribacteria bacterium]
MNPLKLFIVIITIFAAINIKAESLPPREIMRNAVNKYRADDELQEIKMMLIDKEGTKWERTASFFIKKIDNDNDKILFRFYSPADLAGSGVLTIENKQGVDDQWIYVPAYHTARRIPSSNRSDQYMGTDFYYEDVITPRVEEYEYNILGKEKLDKADCLIIEGIAISERLKLESGYSKIVSWVDSQKFMIYKQEFYSKKNGALIKILNNSELKDFKGLLKWGRREMITLSTMHKTIIEYTKHEINKGMSDDYFTVHYLKRGK